MRSFKEFLEVLEFQDYDLDGYNIEINVSGEVLDRYSITTKDNIISIDASNERSVLYAIYDVVSGKKEVSFSSRLKQRGVHLDCGRKYFSSSWIKNLIIEIFKNKLNTIQLHFSENEGFRLEVPGYENLCSRQYINLKELQEILLLAKTLEIKVIPSFDSPGHLQHILKHNPKFLLDGSDTGLDITNQRARDYIKGIYRELLSLFHDSKSFHIGGDEFIDFDTFDMYPQIEIFAKEKFGNHATSIDAYIDYVNEIGQLIMDSGKQVQVWNDPFYRVNQVPTVALNRNFVITYWTSWNRNMAPLHSFIDHGHHVVNYMDSYLYFVVGENAGYTYPTVEKIEAFFEPNIFPNRHSDIALKTKQELSPNDESLKGAMISIWCDKPDSLSQEEISIKFKPLLVAFSKKCYKTIKSS